FDGASTNNGKTNAPATTDPPSPDLKSYKDYSERVAAETIQDALTNGRRVEDEPIRIGDKTYVMFMDFVPGGSPNGCDATFRRGIETRNPDGSKDVVTRYAQPGHLPDAMVTTHIDQNGHGIVTKLVEDNPGSTGFQVGQKFDAPIPSNTNAGPTPQT